MSLYTKALKHIDMSRVKELYEEKIKRKKIADEIKEQIRDELRNLNSPEFSNWRYDIDESMTTSDLFKTTLPATGDVDLVTTEQTFETSFNGNNESVSGGEVILAGSSNSIVGGTHTIYRRAMFKVDGSKASTLKLTIAKGGGTSSWTDRDPPQNFDDDVVVNVYKSGDPFSASYNNANLSSGTHLINLPGQFEDLQIQIEQFAKVSATGALRITGASLQRRTPINVFVSLDSPEATNFIRTDPLMQGLSAEERKKKLTDMLDAGDEYLLKYLGLTSSSARPSDTTMPDSWDQAAALPLPPLPPGPSGHKKPGSYDPNKIFNLAPGSLPSPNIPNTGPGRSNVPGTTDYGNVAQAGMKAPHSNIKYDKQMKQYVPDNPNADQILLDRLKKAKNQKTNNYVVAHHEPEGEVLSEKKKLKSVKDVTSKIPGYYDGKPAPLGFPMQEPPKMVNGFHPDLVDGKKIANRFNRLDPQSAKAMPPTGNPHIDKKVRAAAKKPK